MVIKLWMIGVYSPISNHTSNIKLSNRMTITHNWCSVWKLRRCVCGHGHLNVPFFVAVHLSWSAIFQNQYGIFPNKYKIYFLVFFSDISIHKSLSYSPICLNEILLLGMDTVIIKLCTEIETHTHTVPKAKQSENATPHQHLSGLGFVFL